MSNAIPPGQGPIDPRDAFSPPPPPGGAPGPMPPPGFRAPAGWTPPPMAPPPGMYMMPGYAPQRRRGLRLGTVFLLIALVISVLINFALVGGSVDSNRQVVHSGGADKVAIVPIEEVIMDSTAAKLSEYLQDIRSDKSVKAIVLAVDTPGGSASASDEISHELIEFRSAFNADRPCPPIVVSMGGMATSGGYYVSCGADFIFARTATLTGNIGVYIPNYNVSKLMEKWGIDDTTTFSSNSPYKKSGSPTLPQTDQDKPYWQGLVDAMDKQFIDVVKAGRGKKLNGPDSELYSGKAFSGDTALALGLIDKIGYESDAITYAANMAGLKDPTVFRYVPEPYITRLLTGSKLLVPGPQSTSININGINVDEKAITDLLSPRPMYLWMGR
jgi:protease-4